jgi:hypothetical protein
LLQLDEMRQLGFYAPFFRGLMTNKFSVDRARFLAVAAALAGIASFQACKVEEAAPKVSGAAGESDGGSNNTAGSKMSGAGQATQAGEGGSQAGAGGAAGGEGGVAQGGATISLAGENQGGAAGAGGAGGAGVCDDTVGNANCDGVTAECTPYCNAALANLKPAVAQAAVTCLEADDTANCDAGYSCLAAATAKGCAEDVAADCTAAATTCSDAPAATDPPCQQLLSGFNDTARADVIACTAESCFSVYSCAEGFFFE